MRRAAEAHPMLKHLFRQIRIAFKRHAAKYFVPVIEFCDDCGVRQPLTWTADDALWERVSGKKEGGVLCPKCFDRRASEMGLFIRWIPRVEHEKPVEPSRCPGLEPLEPWPEPPIAAPQA